MCGNGVRCVAQYLYEHGLPRDVLEIDTRMAGRKTLRRLGEGMWQADMGRFDASADALPAVGLGPGPACARRTHCGRPPGTWPASAWATRTA